MVKQIHLIIKAIKSNVNNTHASHACTFSLSLKRTHTQTLAHRHFLSLPLSLSLTHTNTEANEQTFWMKDDSSNISAVDDEPSKPHTRTATVNS